MKKIRIIILSLLLYSASGYGQEITGREYYFDKDLGVGTGTQQSFTASDSVTDNITFSITGLNLGFHRIYTRYQYNNGSWGIAEDRLFYIYDTTTPVPPAVSPAMSSGEYFFDIDPGVGKGTATPAFTSGDSTLQSITFPTAGLGVGFHRIYTRYHDLSSDWGIAEDRLFYVYDTTTPPAPIVQPRIVAGEYFIDNEPGPGHGTSITVSPSVDSLSQTLNIPTTGVLAGTHYLYLRYKDANGKWGIAQQVEFQVCSSLPTASAVALGDTNFCAGASVALQADTGLLFRYQWQNNGIDVANDTNRILVIYDTSGLYRVIVSNAVTGCAAASNAINVIVGSIPTITASGSTTICNGDSVTLTSSLGLTYSWTGGGNTESINVTQGGSYSVTVTTSNNCTVTSAPVNVTVDQGPTPPSVSFSAGTLSTVSGYNSYAWYYSTDNSTFQEIQSSDTNVIAVTLSGYYYVLVGDLSGCTVSSTGGAMFYAATGLPRIGNNNSITVYPNPATDEVILKGDILNNTKTQLQVRDITGKLVEVPYELNADKIKMTTSILAPGVYIVSLKMGEQETTVRFVKQ